MAMESTLLISAVGGLVVAALLLFLRWHWPRHWAWHLVGASSSPLRRLPGPPSRHWLYGALDMAQMAENKHTDVISDLSRWFPFLPIPRCNADGTCFGLSQRKSMAASGRHGCPSLRRPSASSTRLACATSSPRPPLRCRHRSCGCAGSPLVAAWPSPSATSTAASAGSCAQRSARARRRATTRSCETVFFFFFCSPFCSASGSR